MFSAGLRNEVVQLPAVLGLNVQLQGKSLTVTRMSNPEYINQYVSNIARRRFAPVIQQSLQPAPL
jgi:hypothetical protein